MVPFLLAEQAAFEAGEETALPTAGSRRAFGIGKGRNLLSYSQLEAKEVNGDGEVQREESTYARPKAKEVIGDGEVQHEAPAYSQPKATEVSGEGEVQRLPPHEAAFRGDKDGGAGCAFPRGQRRPPSDAAFR